MIFNDVLKALSNSEFQIIVTSDHGSIKVKNDVLVLADRDASSGVRYKYGRNLNTNNKNALIIKDPDRYRLPSLGPQPSYIIAKNENYFVYHTLKLKLLIVFNNDKLIYIVERKTINDLGASIKDGRYKEQKMRCPVHLSIGQESIAVGCSMASSKKDIIFSNYRGHAHFIAHGGDFKAFWSELYGKSNGLSSGKAGSMHLGDLNIIKSPTFRFLIQIVFYILVQLPLSLHLNLLTLPNLVHSIKYAGFCISSFFLGFGHSEPFLSVQSIINLSV